MRRSMTFAICLLLLGTFSHLLDYWRQRFVNHTPLDLADVASIGGTLILIYTSLSNLKRKPSARPLWYDITLRLKSGVTEGRDEALNLVPRPLVNTPSLKEGVSFRSIIQNKIENRLRMNRHTIQKSLH